MRKRLRKKLRKGEFQELGFEFDITFTDKGSDEDFQDEFFEGLIELLNATNLEMIGGWNNNTCRGLMRSRKGTVTPERREAVNEWLGRQEEIKTYTLGELRDIWYSWK